MIKKLLSIAGLLLVFLLFVLAGAALWLRRAYPPERVRVLAAEKLGDRIGRRVEIAEARISLRRGLELTGIRISEKPDFSAGVFAEASALRIALRLRPLFRGALVFRTAELAGLRLRLVRDAQGLLNISDLVSKEEMGDGAHTPSISDSPAAAFLFSEAAIRDGEVIYEDWVRRVEIRLSGLEGRADDISPARPVRFKLSGDARLQTAAASWSVAFETDARLSFANGGQLEVINLQASTNRSRVSVTGSVADFEAPSASLAVKATPLSLEDISPLMDIPVWLRPLRLTLDSQVRGSTGNFTVEGQVVAELSGSTLSGNISAGGQPTAKGSAWTARLEPREIRIKDQAFAPELTVEGTGAGALEVSGQGNDWSAAWELDGRKLAVSYGGWMEKAQGSSLTVSGRTRPAFEIHFGGDNLVLKPGGPWPSPLSLEGPMAVQARLAGEAKNLEFDLALNADRLKAERGEALRKSPGKTLALAAAGRFLAPGEIRFSALRLETEAGILTARGRVQPPWAKPSLEGSVEGLLDVEKLSRCVPALAAYNPRGRAAVSATVRGPSDDRRLEGTVALREVTVRPLPGVLLSNLKGIIAFSPQGARLAGLKGTAFGSPFQLEGELEGFSRPTLILDGRWARLEADKVLGVFRSTGPAAAAGASRSKKPAPLARSRGTFRVDEITHPHYVGREFVFGWDLAEVGRDLSALSGTATVTADSGEIRNLPVARKINKLMGQDASRMTYKKLSATFLTENGVAQTNDFSLDSDQTDFWAQGHVNLLNRDADILLVLKLPPGSVRGSLGQWITAEDGRPTLDARLTGPLSDPRVEKGEFLRQTGSRAVQDILKKTLGGWKGKK